MNTPLKSLIAFIALITLNLSVAAQNPTVETELLQSADIAVPGSIHRLALSVELEKGYKVNSNTPNDEFLIPTVLKATPPEGVEVLEIVYPEHIEMITGGMPTPLAVYKEHFTLGIALKIADTTPPGELTIPLSLRYQACDDRACYQPKTLKLDATVTVAEPGTSITSQNDDVFSAIAFSEAATTTQESDSSDPALETEVEAAPTAEGDILALLDKFEVLGSVGGSMPPEDFLQFIADAESGVQRKGLFEGKGPVAIVLLVLIGGLALNLTPCVLPMIPINLAIIGAGAQSGSRSRGFILGGAYGLAMAVVYGALGLIVILTAGSFGAINASPWFNVGIAVLFVVLALAMFDVIVIDFSKLQGKLNLTDKGKKGSVPLAFGMGGVAALLAGACVAPIVIQVIVFSSDLYNRGATIALALPFFLGVGMAIPWPLAGAGMSVMPKPGAWMVRVKQAMGVFILGFAAYYAYLAYGIFDSRNVEEGVVAESARELLEDGWVPSMTAGLEQALAEDKPVLVDMWATWCKNCFVMDKTTLKDPTVETALEDYVKIKYQSEDLEVSPTKEVLKRFDGIGLPHYAILRPKAE